MHAPAYDYYVQQKNVFYCRSGFQPGKGRDGYGSALGLRDDDRAGYGERVKVVCTCTKSASSAAALKEKLRSSCACFRAYEHVGGYAIRGTREKMLT